jgi:hypothetical protein
MDGMMGEEQKHRTKHKNIGRSSEDGWMMDEAQKTSDDLRRMDG